MIDNFKEELRIRLKGPLPGIEAQRDMMPVNQNRFDYKQRDPRLGGVLLLLYPHRGQFFFPLTQRHEYEGTHGGQVSLPGGKWEEGDMNIQQTALREAQEEIGIVPEQVEIIGQLTELTIPVSNFKISPVIGVLNKRPQFTIDSYEVKELIETPLSLLNRKETRKRKDILVRNETVINAPYFAVQDKVVWGATAMVLAELVSVMRDVNYKF